VEPGRAGGFLTKYEDVGWVRLLFLVLRDQLWKRSQFLHYWPLPLPRAELGRVFYLTAFGDALLLGRAG
jgi:hypothetical protein